MKISVPDKTMNRFNLFLFSATCPGPWGQGEQKCKVINIHFALPTQSK